MNVEIDGNGNVVRDRKAVRDVPIGTPATKCPPEHVLSTSKTLAEWLEDDDMPHWKMPVPKFETVGYSNDGGKTWTNCPVVRSPFGHQMQNAVRDFQDASIAAAMMLKPGLTIDFKTTPTKVNNVQTPVEAAAKRYSENKYGADLGSQLVRAADMATLANEYGWLKDVSSVLDKVRKERDDAEKESQILTAIIAQRDESLEIVRRLWEQDLEHYKALKTRADELEYKLAATARDCSRRECQIIDAQAEEKRQLIAKVQEKETRIRSLEHAGFSKDATIQDKDRRISNLAHDVRELTAAIADARDVVANKNVEIEGLKEEVKGLEASCHGKTRRSE